MQGNTEDENVRLFNQWKKKWENEAEAEKLETFFELYQEVFQSVLCKMNKNKEKNYAYKKYFLGVLVVGFVFYMGYMIFCFIRKESSIADLGFILAAFIWLETIISKWLDIKKYQETWARHSWHLYMMKREMLCFVNQVKPYGNMEDRKVFVERILDIWDKNQEKFVHNLEEKEKGLMDVFENISVE